MCFILAMPLPGGAGYLCQKAFSISMTITQVRHESGLLGYLLVRSTAPGESSFLYAPGTDFEVECLMQLGRLTA